MNTPNKSLQVRLSQQHLKQSTFSLEVDLTLPNRGVTALFGPSGSGKTTLLRCIAGLETQQQGDISLNEVVWQSPTHSLPAHKRPIGYVFQEANLFPHLTSEENLQFAVKRADTEQSVITYEDVVSLLNIAAILPQYPHQLSGGERQRVAMARALLVQPRLLLMDEPLSALDDGLKQEILPYLEQICQRAQIPIIYVSHALDEVIRLADYIVVLEKGRVIEQGEKYTLLGRLGTSFSRHQDASVVVSGTVTQQAAQWGLSWLTLNDQTIAFKQGKEQIGDLVSVRIQSRDVSLSLSKQDDSSILNRLTATIDDMDNDPKDTSMVMVRLLVGDTPILARITALSAHNLALHKGQTVIAQIKSVALLR
ncbi:molybdenum ABC transporter ATP-binding protein [Marinomonas sp. A79]|uniref:Molybdenum ABC transporter ATP-binding protein n=1 Tax=Marinomonas vulgaris TaxID=2823372 RepID=A0ABS5H7G4_9GAMM|nr:molybdenum ABC transporter ATP-binding protein [Marinomonas vulgaris]MBR7887387.1 molybdenum ABC transporter ATP-binding protein [Marinomonas vulgaris]